jgi:excisionase family DNA binding protein
MDDMTVAQASASLGVSRDRVRKLAVSGDIPARKVGGTWLVDRQVVDRWVLAPPAREGGRPWSPQVAWAVLTLLDGDRSAFDALPRKTRYRIRQRLDGADGLASIAARLRGRGAAQRFALHASLREQLRQFGPISGPEAAQRYGVGLLGGDELEVYIPEQQRRQVLDSVPLRPSADGAVVVRWVGEGAAVSRGVAPRAAVALDLGEDPDPRAQQTSQALAAEVDEWWR